MIANALSLLTRFAMKSSRLTKNCVKQKLFDLNRNGELYVCCVEDFIALKFVVFVIT